MRSTTAAAISAARGSAVPISAVVGGGAASRAVSAATRGAGLRMDFSVTGGFAAGRGAGL